MDFDFSDDQEMLRDTVRKWVEKSYDFERRRSIVKSGGFSRDSWQGLADLGLLGLAVPEAQGGMGFGPVDAMVVMEELGRGLVVEPFAAVSLVAAPMLVGNRAPSAGLWLQGVAEGMFEDRRFRDEIARLEVDVVALEMMVLRVLAAEKSGKQPLDIAGLLKIRGSEIQQRYTELMMLAAGPYSVPFIYEAMEAGWQGDQVGAAHCAPLAGSYFNMRKTTIYGGSNEVQRNIVAQSMLGV